MIAVAPVVRFAPSATGLLHVGNMRTAAQKAGPERAKLLPLIGRAKAVARLSGTLA